MSKTAFSALIAAVLVAGCQMPGTSVGPTPYPSSYLPTVIYLTAQSIDRATLAARPPTKTPTPTPHFFPVTLVPTETPTGGPGVPLGDIQIKTPGPMSRVVSPLLVHLTAVAGGSHRVEVDLFGEDGRLLGRTISAVSGDPEGDTLSFKIPFEIRAAGETGFLQVSTNDSQGRVQSLVTLRILLLSSGTSQINPAGNTIYERIAFSNWPEDQGASGGVLPLEGQFMPYSRQPFILWLKAEDGRTLSQRVLTVAGTDWQSFKTTLPFKVDQPLAARLVVLQADDVLKGEAYVFSRRLTLNP
jgi:hypothetical protein